MKKLEFIGQRPRQGISREEISQEAVKTQPLGKEHDDHEKEDEHQGGHAHHRTHHLELRDHPIAAHAFVPDVVLHIAPGCKVTQREGPHPCHHGANPSIVAEIGFDVTLRHTNSRSGAHKAQPAAVGPHGATEA
ncbi:hypothetical protein EYF80_004076 [Liparis tanakae]|uniref:Uncharacterized protein n=1 Tax=Liparis tanakae TaxID=230148 RepID=A0A4Z2J6L6_9TELE|nr:hypothetical protein EYF80_004076 [Liparis tanakae]